MIPPRRTQANFLGNKLALVHFKRFSSGNLFHEFFTNVTLTHIHDMELHTDSWRVLTHTCTLRRLTEEANGAREASGGRVERESEEEGGVRRTGGGEKEADGASTWLVECLAAGRECSSCGKMRR